MSVVLGETLAIETHGLTRRFGETVAVADLTLEVAAGAVFGLLGPNGSGKTTLIKMLTTILPPSSGSARVAGFDVVRKPQEVHRRIGCVSQALSADRALTGYENRIAAADLAPLSSGSPGDPTASAQLGWCSGQETANSAPQPGQTPPAASEPPSIRPS